MTLRIGAARTRLTPYWGVELAGWGYYLGRTWQRVRDHTAATAVVLDDDRHRLAIIGVDLMYADAAFCAAVRAEVARHVPIAPEAICVACSHSHNTPTAGTIRGAGEIDPRYVEWAAHQAATAAILAHRQARPARLLLGALDLPGWTYNRSRPDAPVDTRLTVWRIEDETRRPLAALVNFAGHPTVQMCLGPADLGRDYPGQVTDLLERELPGVTAVFLQGACGEVNIRADCHNVDRCHTPGVAIAQAALQAWRKAQPVDGHTLGYVEQNAVLPTRAWEETEVRAVLQEATHRLTTGDTTGWLDGLARVIVNEPAKLPARYGGSVEAAVHAVSRFGLEWAEHALASLNTPSQGLPMRFQALRVGGASLVAIGAEFFSSLALRLREQWGQEVIIAGYANESVGYLPDADDVRRRTYAAYQSPRFKGTWPFTEQAGDRAVNALLDALNEVRGER